MGTGYQPTSAGSEMMAEATAHVLGGGGIAVDSTDLSPAERRARVLEATLRRLQVEEKEIEDMCGSSQAHGGS